MLAGLGGGWCGAALGAYRFESPGVLDVSTDEHLVPQKADAIPTAPLAADAAQAILAAPEVGNDAPGQLPMLNGSNKAARKQERARLAAEPAAVQRSGGTLTIRTQSGGPVAFTDRPPAARADADADGEFFLYAGRIGAAGYQRVEERFEQDAPGSYLVNTANGKTLFVPNGSYEVQLSPDGKWLLSMSSGDTRVLLVVMALDAEGPRLALICHGGNSVNAGPAVFKGWHDEKSLDLVLNPLAIAPGKPGQGSATVLATEPIPLRIAFDGQGWHPEVRDPRVLEKVGYVCRR